MVFKAGSSTFVSPKSSLWGQAMAAMFLVPSIPANQKFGSQEMQVFIVHRVTKLNIHGHIHNIPKCTWWGHENQDYILYKYNFVVPFQAYPL